MRLRVANLILGVLSLAGCASSASGTDAGTLDLQTAGLFSEDRKYERQIPDCVPGGLANCTQYGTFGKDGSAFVLLTDEGNAGTYQINGSKLIATFFTHGDGGSGMTFTLSADRETVVNDSDGFTWLRTSP